MELQQAYGRNRKTKAEVIADFRAGKDFAGDYSIGFAYTGIADFKTGETVMLRFDSDRKVAVVKV